MPDSICTKYILQSDQIVCWIPIKWRRNFRPVKISSFLPSHSKVKVKIYSKG